MISLDKKIKLGNIALPTIDYEDILHPFIDNILQSTLSSILKTFQNKKFIVEEVPPQKFLWFTIANGYSLASSEYKIYQVYSRNVYEHISEKYDGNTKSDIREYYNNNKMKFFRDMCRTLETYLMMYIDNIFIDIHFCENSFRRTDNLHFTIEIGFEKND